jgi:DNA-binding MarR family transcriptional regulator
MSTKPNAKFGAKSGELDRTWQALVSLVMDTRGNWRREVGEATGLPFSRLRALKRIAKGPISLGDLAEEMAVDRPAATVAVNDLVERGLAERRVDENDARLKIVSVTKEGKRVMSTVYAVPDPAPDALAKLPAKDIAELIRILKPLVRAKE